MTADINKLTKTLGFEDLLKAPTYVINLKRCEDRLSTVLPRIAAAGFTNVQVWPAVDAKDPEALMKGWALHGSPPLDTTDEEFCVSYKGKQGCFLSWVSLLKHIIDNNTPLFVGFEDDVVFHSSWKELAPVYVASTPDPFDIVYLGGQIECSPELMKIHHIGQFPTFCTNALVISLVGAKKLYDLLVKCPKGCRTIDCMLIDAQKQMIMKQSSNMFIWYSWNASMFPDPKGVSMNPGWAKRNNGLVFQDDAFVSEVRVW